MAKRFLIASTVDWNTLSPAEQAVYEDHYETLALFLTAIDGTSDTVPYYVTWFGISESISSSLSVNVDLNGNNIEFDGEDKLSYSDNVATDAIVVNNVGGGECIFKNSAITFDVLKGNGNAFVLNLSLDTVVVHHFFLEGNDNNASLLYHSSDGISRAFRNIIKNTRRGFSCNDAQGLLELENNTIIAAEEKGVARFSGTVNIYKNYFDGVPGVSGISADDGSNFTSDDTAPTVANRNVSLVDAFVNAAGGDYTPNPVLAVSGPLQVTGNSGSSPFAAGALNFPSDGSNLIRSSIIQGKSKKIAMELL